MNEWIERCSAPSADAAKRAAGAADIAIWRLPSGHYIALGQGPPVPPGSTLMAHRFRSDQAWLVTGPRPESPRNPGTA